MRFPEFLKEHGTIGFVAPSFGCATEPYYTAFAHARERFGQMGYHTQMGSNCLVDKGIGISNDPALCGKELNESYCGTENDVIISCGGGELMCEVVPYIDFAGIAQAKPKWYMGFSDNTNFTFLSATIADTAAIYSRAQPRLEWNRGIRPCRTHWICFAERLPVCIIMICGRKNLSKMKNIRWRRIM